MSDGEDFHLQILNIMKRQHFQLISRMYVNNITFHTFKALLHTVTGIQTLQTHVQ